MERGILGHLSRGCARSDAWADEKAGSERTYTLYIRVDDDGRWADQSFFIQIAGANPTRNPTFSDGFERKPPTEQAGDAARPALR